MVTTTRCCKNRIYFCILFFSLSHTHTLSSDVYIHTDSHLILYILCFIHFKYIAHANNNSSRCGKWTVEIQEITTEP